MKTNKFYIYFYLDSNLNPYYIGKGSDNRAYDKNHIRNGISFRPHDDRIILIHTNLTEEKAFEYEKWYIREYGRIDLGTGILINLTDGGEGSSGYQWTQEYKETRIGINHSNAKLSEEEVINIRKSASDGISFNSLAINFKMDITTIIAICKGKIWKHISGPIAGIDYKYKNGGVVLEEDDVLKIRELAFHGQSYASIAKKYNIKDTTVRNICCGFLWKKIAGPIAGIDYENKISTCLTEIDICDIQNLICLGHTQRSIAKKYNVCEATISNIRKGKTHNKIYKKVESDI